VVRNVYVTSMDRGSGKSAVVLGLAEVLSCVAGRLAVFRPLIGSHTAPDADIALLRARYQLPQKYAASYALTPADLRHVTDPAGYEELLKRVLASYRALADGAEGTGCSEPADVVVVEGSDFTAASLAMELDLNVDAANHLGCPVLLVVRGRDRSSGQVLDGVAQGIAVLSERGCTLLGVVANRVDAAAAEAVRAGMPGVVGGLAGAVIPEMPMLAIPTVGEVADALGSARFLRRGGLHQDGGDAAVGSLHREVRRVVIGAMGLEHFLDGVVDGDLVITSGDRVDIVAGSLAAHLAATYPAVAGLLLTGGLVAEPIYRLMDGIGDAGVPVVTVDSDTYSTAAAVGAVRGAITPRTPSKIATAIRLFEDHVDTATLTRQICVTRPARVTPLMFEHALIELAKADRRHIVLPEGDDDRVLAAADQLLHRGVVDLTALGVEREVRARGAALGLALPGLRVVDPLTCEHRESFARTYFELRRHKGVTEDMAFDVMSDVAYFGTMMVHQGLADGMVSGAAHTTAHTIRPALELVRTAPGVSVVSSVFFMCLADRVLVYGDCAVVPNPDVEQLADIAISAAGTATQFGVEPRIAMLSYSTGESGSGADVEKVRRGTAIVRERRPDLLVEGPIQYDAAVDPDVARVKLPTSPVAGRATVFIFPDLNTGNNTYKAVQRTAGAVAIGPVLQGLNKPVNDLSRGARVPDIVNAVAITAIQVRAMSVRA
jgi:phosphate acetyltransferase